MALSPNSVTRTTGRRDAARPAGSLRHGGPHTPHQHGCPLGALSGRHHAEALRRSQTLGSTGPRSARSSAREAPDLASTERAPCAARPCDRRGRTRRPRRAAPSGTRPPRNGCHSPAALRAAARQGRAGQGRPRDARRPCTTRALPVATSGPAPSLPRLPSGATPREPPPRPRPAPPGTPKGPGTLRYPGPSVHPPRAPEREAQVLPGWIRRSEDHLMIFVTRPDPTVRPPSRMAKPRPSSMAIGWISSTVISVLSPGMTISVPSGSVMTPVTSVVRK